MPDDDNNLVWRLLREMRSVLDQHSRQLEGIGRLEKQMDNLHESTITALGFAAHANVRHESTQRQIDDLTARVERLERGETEPAD